MIAIAVALAFLGLALHPFFTYPLSLRLLTSLRRRPSSSPGDQVAARPRFSICVCAYNEQAVIAEKAQNLLDMRRAEPGLQILIYVDGATDGTAEKLAPFRDRLTVVAGSQRRGKSFGMRELVRRATGDILVFSDANVLVEPQALNALGRYFADPAVGCVCGALEYRNDGASDTSAVNSRYWRHEEQVKQLESRFGNVMGADGSLFAVRRDLYPHVPDDIMEDFYVSLSVLCDGHRVVRAGDVRAYELSVVKRNEEFQRKVRIACMAFNIHRLMWPRLRRLPALGLYCYVSHKLLRWLAAPLLTGSMILFAVGMAQVLGSTVTTLILGSGLLIGVAAYAVGIRPVRRAYEIWLALLATFIGVLRSVSGERFQTWEPAQSIRTPLRPSLASSPDVLKAVDGQGPRNRTGAAPTAESLRT